MNQNSVIDITRCKIIFKIGEGAFGKSYCVKDIKTGNNYAAKISKLMIDEDTTKNNSEFLSLLHTVNSMSFLSHPSVLKFYGYYLEDFEQDPLPMIITEFAINGSLNCFIEMERKGFNTPDWTPTKNLINIYGIASGMSYLHAHNILHRELKSENILLDDFLHPKIADFGLAKINDFIFSDIVIKSPPVYAAPEILINEKYSKASDVYSFAFIVYEIMTCEKPYKDCKIFTFIQKILSGERPKINDDIPDPYRSLIERCWSQNQEDRPSFDEIVKELKENSGFITDFVDKSEFLKYVDFIDGGNQTFDKKTIIYFEDLSQENKPIQLDTPKKKKKKSHHHHHHKKRKNSAIKESKSESKNESNSKPNNGSSQLEIIFDINQYEKLKKIGEGSFAEVFKVKEKQTGKIYAAKVSKNILQMNDDEEEEDNDEPLDINLQREVNNSNMFNHPAIVKFIGFSLFDFSGSKRPVMVIEYISGGTLSSLLQKAKQSIPDTRYNETKKLIIIYGIAAAMCFLHDHNIIHRDLKPDNILLDEDLNPKIADFGLSKTLHSNQESMSVSSKAGFKGTIRYSSPEKLSGEPSTKACDVYAFSLIVYEIMTDETPFENYKYFTLLGALYKNERPQFKPDIPEAYKELIESCWDQDPEKRPTFSQIVDALKTERGFITDLVDEGEFLRYVDYIDETPSSFIKNKIIPTFKEFCKEKSVQKVVETSITTQAKSTSLSIKKDVESDTTIQRSAPLSAKKDQASKEDNNNNNDDDSLEEIQNKEADELFEIWEKMFYSKESSSAQQKNSLKYVKLAAEKGHITAMFSYASMLYNGIGTQINRNQASVYFKKAADEGHIESMHIYASIMNKGDGVIINSNEALKYFKKAADKGHVESMYRYAMMQYKNYSPSRNEEEAKIYCKKAADNGHVNAMYSYAIMLSKNEQSKSDNLKEEEIKNYFKKAAENGHIKAMFNLAQLLCKDKENKDLIKEAAKFYKIAADNGHVDAMHFYADLLRKNEGDYLCDLKNEFPYYYKLAADNGNVDSMFCYAEILRKGIGVSANKEESAKYYKMAADKGKKEAMLIYADILRKGIGVPANKIESKIYIQMAKNIK